MTNNHNTVFYTGITNNIYKRIWQHKNKIIKGFTSKYNINKLVYYQTFYYPDEAIAREKQIKRWSREKKLNLIKKINPNLEDLTEKENWW